MNDPESDEKLRRVESELGVTFPADYREFILAFGGVEGDFGGCWLRLFEIDELVRVNHGYALAENYPGLVIIGSDGGGEAVGFDFRSEQPPIVLVNFISSGWHEAIVQTNTFDDFMAQRNAGAGYNFDTNHWSTE